MSKISKLFKKPDQFFVDMVKKRSRKNSSMPVTKKTELVIKNNQNLGTTSKTITKESAMNTSKPKQVQTSTTIFDHIRLFRNTKHLLHTGEGINCAFHLELWVGEFISSKEDFAIMIRNLELYKWAIQKYPYLDIVYAKTAMDVESILNKLPFLKAIYYFSNTGNLIHSLRFNTYKHIFLGHGDSDKAASAHKFFRVYDEIWVAGQAHIDRFKNADFKIGHIDFIKVGRPPLKHIIRNTLSAISKEKKISSITYFPTWEGAFEENNYSSAHLSVVALSEVQKTLNCKINAKYHPLTGNRDNTYQSVGNSLQDEFFDRPYMLNLANKDTPVASLIIESDAFICDISAVVSECISSLSPIFIYIPKDRNVVTSNSDMQYSDYAYIYSSIEELMTLINDVIVDGKDYLSEARYKALDYLLSINETVNDEFHNQLRRIGSHTSLVENKRELIS